MDWLCASIILYAMWGLSWPMDWLCPSIILYAMWGLSWPMNSDFAIFIHYHFCQVKIGLNNELRLCHFHPLSFMPGEDWLEQWTQTLSFSSIIISARWRLAWTMNSDFAIFIHYHLCQVKIGLTNGLRLSFLSIILYAKWGLVWISDSAFVLVYQHLFNCLTIHRVCQFHPLMHLYL